MYTDDYTVVGTISEIDPPGNTENMWLQQDITGAPQGNVFDVILYNPETDNWDIDAQYTAQNGDIWLNANIDTEPTLYIFNNSAWSAYTPQAEWIDIDYTPQTFDVWLNINTGVTGTDAWYWHVNRWDEFGPSLINYIQKKAGTAENNITVFSDNGDIKDSLVPVPIPDINAPMQKAYDPKLNQWTDVDNLPDPNHVLDGQEYTSTEIEKLANLNLNYKLPLFNTDSDIVFSIDDLKITITGNNDYNNEWLHLQRLAPNHFAMESDYIKNGQSTGIINVLLQSTDNNKYLGDMLCIIETVNEYGDMETNAITTNATAQELSFDLTNNQKVTRTLIQIADSELGSAYIGNIFSGLDKTYSYGVVGVFNTNQTTNTDVSLNGSNVPIYRDVVQNTTYPNVNLLGIATLAKKIVFPENCSRYFNDLGAITEIRANIGSTILSYGFTNFTADNIDLSNISDASDMFMGTLGGWTEPASLFTNYNKLTLDLSIFIFPAIKNGFIAYRTLDNIFALYVQQYTANTDETKGYVGTLCVIAPQNILCGKTDPNKETVGSESALLGHQGNRCNFMFSGSPGAKKILYFSDNNPDLVSDYCTNLTRRMNVLTSAWAYDRTKFRFFNQDVAIKIKAGTGNTDYITYQYWSGTGEPTNEQISSWYGDENWTVI
jgi:hypothetical protein